MTALLDRQVDDDVPPQFVLPAPLASVSADLMPDEIRVHRRLIRLQRVLLAGLALLLVVVALGYVFARHGTSKADGELAAENSTIASLNGQAGTFTSVQAIQGETETIRGQLAQVTTDDVSWTRLLDRVTAAAPTGLHVSQLTGQMDDPSATSDTGEIGTLATSTDPTVGTLSLTGQAQSWPAVTAYVSSLSAVPGFTAVTPGSLSSGVGSGNKAGGVTFTITLNLTSQVLDNRYATTTTGTTTTGTTTTGTPSGTTTTGTTPSGATMSRGASRVLTGSAAKGGTASTSHGSSRGRTNSSVLRGAPGGATNTTSPEAS